MSDETRLAFAHPAERAAACSDPAPADRISLRDYLVEVEIGAFQAERDTTQRVRFNIVVEVSAPTGPLADDVDKILSYDTLIEAIHAELAAERLNLLETLAERVALAILRDPRAARVFVRVEKLDRVPGALGVEIVRSRDDATPRTTGQGDTSQPYRDAQGVDEGVPDASPLDQPRPVVAFLGQSALTDPRLPQFVADLRAQPDPVILSLGAPDAGPKLPDDPSIRRRIALLGIEQAAWALTARLPGLQVSDSRTELDWAMKNGQTSVWAPSRLVLDSANPPRPDADPAELTQWLAGQLNARRVIYVRATPGDTPDGAPDAANPAFEYRSLSELDPESP